MRIVIVDDHPVVRRGLEQTIELEADMEVVGVADSTAAGVETITAARPDLAVVDLKMPGGGGLALIRRCREKIDGCRYIILTSYASYHDLAAAFGEKVEGYILKDALPEEFIAAVRIVAKGRRYYDPQAMDYFRSESEKDPLKMFTAREMETLHCLAAGQNNKEISRALYISENTVKKHISNILAKLDLEDRTQAALFAYSHGLAKNMDKPFEAGD